MSLGELWTFFSKYGDVVIGVVLLLAASFVLPPQVRKYVLTAGLAIALFRVAQLKVADIRLAGADRKRKQLQKTLSTLDDERNAAIKRKEDLDKELVEAKRQQSDLAKQADALTASGAGITEQKRALDEQTRKMVERQKELITNVQAEDRVLALFRSADEAVEDLGRVK